MPGQHHKGYEAWPGCMFRQDTGSSSSWNACWIVLWVAGPWASLFPSRAFPLQIACLVPIIWVHLIASLHSSRLPGDMILLDQPHDYLLVHCNLDLGFLPGYASKSCHISFLWYCCWSLWTASIMHVREKHPWASQKMLPMLTVFCWLTGSCWPACWTVSTCGNAVSRSTASPLPASVWS